MSDDNIKLEIKDIAQDNIKTATLNSDDLAAITDLINNETENTSSFNNAGLYTGIGLLGGGLVLTTVSLCLCKNTNTDSKPKRIIRKTTSLLGIPLTAAGIIFTAYFALNVTHNANIVL